MLKTEEISNFSCKGRFPNGVLRLDVDINVISSPTIKSKIGLGLGTFIGKTLLEKNYGKVTFSNSIKTKGAFVSVVWSNDDLNKI